MIMIFANTKLIMVLLACNRLIVENEIDYENSTTRILSSYSRTLLMSFLLLVCDRRGIHDHLSIAYFR